MTHPSPRYSIFVDGKDITVDVAERLRNLTLVDNRGFEADQLDLQLDDTDGLLDLPPRGAQIRVALGWLDSGLVDKGSYLVDEVEHGGTPDQLTLRARSADLRVGLATQRERSWHGQTVGEIVSTIARENDLEPLVSPELKPLVIEHIDQTNESAANFLTRLAGLFDAMATVKSGRLLFIHLGGGTSASGTALPAVLITREAGDTHRFAIADRETYTAVQANYYDTARAEKGEVIWGKPEDESERRAQATPSSEVTAAAIERSAENIKTLRHVYANRENARRAARAEWRRLQRGMATFSITFARGRPELFPEIPATVRGFKPAIDSTEWLLTRVTHNVGDSGYTTAIELEIRATDIAG